jgi:flagellar biosynthetic protein FliO
MEIVQQAAAVAGVLLLLLGTLWWLRRGGFAALNRMSRKPGRRMQCLERLHLGPQQTLHLVQLGDKVLLVSSGPSGCALIQSFGSSEIDTPRGGVE